MNYNKIDPGRVGKGDALALYHLLNDLEIELQYCTYRDFPKNWTYYIGVNGSHRLWYIIQGEVVVQSKKFRYRCGMGELMLLPPSDGMEFINSGDSNLLMYSNIFKAKNRMGIELHTLLGGQVIYEVDDSKFLLSTLNQMHDEFRHGRVGYQLMIKSKLLELLATIVRSEHDRQVQSAPAHNAELTRLWPLVRYIEENSSNYPNIPDMARILSISEVHLRRLFRKHLSVSPNHFVIGIKMNQAKKMLLETVLPVGDIAYQLGYQNQNYFTKVFRRYHGHTPRECRSRQV
jgi:AraC-like DNA-binding protein